MAGKDGPHPLDHVMIVCWTGSALTATDAAYKGGHYKTDGGVATTCSSPFG
jgi:hypothetical protein